MTILFTFEKAPKEIELMFRFCGIGKYVIINGGILCYNSPIYRCAFMPLYKNIPEGKIIGDPFKSNIEIYLIDPTELKEAENNLIELIKSEPKVKGYKIKNRIYIILYKEHNNENTNNERANK